MPGKETIIESRLDDGVDTCSLKDFVNRNQIIHMLQAPLTADEEIELYNRVYNGTKGVDYDKPAILYWVYVGLMRKIFDTDIPRRNALDKDELLYCVEVLDVLREYLEEIGVDTAEIDFGMTSPEMAYNVLVEFDVFREIPC